MSSTPTDTSTLDLAGEIRVVLSQLVRRLREQTGTIDVTKSQMSVLLRLERERSSTLTALAHAEGVRPQSMAATVAALESAGLVRREPHPEDGRKTVLSITGFALEQFRTGRLAKEDWLFRAIRSQLTDDEQAELAASLPLYKRLLGFE